MRRAATICSAFARSAYGCGCDCCARCHVCLTHTLTHSPTTYTYRPTGKQRKVCKVPYPRMVSSNPEDGFSKAMRVHYNTLESMPQYIVMQVLAGLWWPMYAVVAGLLWIVGRALYANGYMKRPEARLTGSTVFLVGLLLLLIGSVALAINIILGH